MSAKDVLITLLGSLVTLTSHAQINTLELGRSAVLSPTNSFTGTRLLSENHSLDDELNKGLDQSDQDLHTSTQSNCHQLSSAYGQSSQSDGTVVNNDDGSQRGTTATQLIGYLVAIPSGSFRMGDINRVGYDDELPIHEVEIAAFCMQSHEITWNQYQYCIDAGVCPDNSASGGDNGWGKGNRPVINVSWMDITEKYIPWLNNQTGKTFRLPFEAEWEYAARAGSSTKYSWGNGVDSSKANYDHRLNGKTMPVKSYAANDWGLYDMHGNVWEWTQDCWNDNYTGAPKDGSAWVEGDCNRRVKRGGSWEAGAIMMRSAVRFGGLLNKRNRNNGFRLVHD